MRCPECKAHTDVKETRQLQGNVVKRKRLCFNDHTFYTEERPIKKVKREQPTDKG
jgi:transcriptional regulator NrdR family protein